MSLRTEDFSLAAWSNGDEPKTCIEVTSEHTPINFPSRKNSIDMDFTNLATAVAASERVHTDLGHLTSPLFTHESEVSANPKNLGSYFTAYAVCLGISESYLSTTPLAKTR